MKLGCVIMAAGESRRFGENKLLRTFRGVPLYVRALDAVPPGVFDRVCVVTAYEPVAEYGRERGYLSVRNDHSDWGISRTIKLGLSSLSECDGVLFMAADQPLLTQQTLLALANAFRQTPDSIVSASHAGSRGNPCVFPKALFRELMALQGDTGGSRVIKAHPDKLRLVEVPAEELADCDTAEALSKLEEKSGN